MEDLERLRHDLKNVLTALDSGCRLLEMQLAAVLDEEGRDVLAEMRAAVRQGRELVEELREPGA
jgi:light-regulated signal transduction histidine kinase (bacteriophytochrome)